MINDETMRLIDKTHGCWEWKGKIVGGYPVVQFYGVRRRVDRMLYEHYIAPISEYEFMIRECRNKNCVSPMHVVISARSVPKRKFRNPYDNRTHCIRGHEWNDENSYTRKNGTRDCVLCRREANLRYRQRKADLEHERHAR